MWAARFLALVVACGAQETGGRAGMVPVAEATPCAKNDVEILDDHIDRPGCYHLTGPTTVREAVELACARCCNHVALFHATGHAAAGWLLGNSRIATLAVRSGDRISCNCVE